ncbi:hypothetical protein, partial [Anaerotruncus colihominis]|uniref:hypothetical protein n=1 Tax=Anaerotruncus colihominis TaxID=169435 RepID=UPI0021093770
MTVKKGGTNLKMLVADLEPIVYRAEQLSSFCLVINNALESGSTNEEQYIPAIELLGELMAEFYQTFSDHFEQIHPRGEQIVNAVFSAQGEHLIA